jgi:hypothetical protein
MGGALSKFFSLFLSLALLTTAGVNFYLVFLLGQTPLPIDKIRRTAILTAVGILVFIVLLIVFFIFAGIVAKSLFRGKSGLLSLFVILLLGVVMGLDFAIPPVIKRAEAAFEAGETDELDLGRARLFALIAAAFGTLLFIFTLIYFIARITKSSKQQKALEGETTRKDKKVETVVETETN